MIIILIQIYVASTKMLSVSDQFECVLKIFKDEIQWEALSQNTSISAELVRTHPDLPWDWYFVSRKDDLDLEFVKEFVDKELDWNYLSSQPFITLDFVEEHLDKPWCWPSISMAPYVTMEDVESRSRLVGVWHDINLCHNPNLSIDFIKDHIEWDWKWGELSSNSNIATPENIENNMHFNWNWRRMSRSTSINLEFVLKHIDKNWNWDVLSSNKSVALDKNNKLISAEVPWNMMHVLQIPSLDLEDRIQLMLQERIHTKRQDGRLHFPNECFVNPKITMDIINRYPEFPWSWSLISMKRNITLEEISANIHKPWDWMLLSSNPFITLEFVLSHPDKYWDWSFLTTIFHISDILANPKLNWNQSSLFYNPTLLDTVTSWNEEIMDTLTIPTRELIITSIYVLNLPLELVYEILECE